MQGETFPIEYSGGDIAKFVNTGLSAQLELRERNSGPGLAVMFSLF